jgi:hypothetical protein
VRHLLIALQTAAALSGSGDPFAFFRPSIAVTAADRRQLDQGKPIARTLPGEDREVAVFAAVPIDIDGDRLVAWMRRIAELKKSAYVLAIGRFSDPPRIEDLAGLVLDEDDLSDLRQCRPGACGIKLTGPEIAELSDLRGKSGSNWRPALQDWYRAVVLRRVQAYRDGGRPVLGAYADGDRLDTPAARFSDLLRHSAFLADHVPQLARYLEQYPRAPAAGVESFIYWSKERLGPRAVIRVTHLAILRGMSDAVPDALVAGAEIFASHYLNASLGITVITRGAVGARRYLVYLNRSEIDGVGGLFGGIVRWFVERRLKSEAADVLTGLRQRLESGGPPP